MFRQIDVQGALLTWCNGDFPALHPEGAIEEHDLVLARAEAQRTRRSSHLPVVHINVGWGVARDVDDALRVFRLGGSWWGLP